MAAAPPAAGEGGLTFGLILLAITCVFLLALNKAYQFTFGSLLNAMANMVSTLPHVTVFGTKVPPWDALANGLLELNNYVLAGIGTGIQATEKGMHALIGAMTWLLQETADQLAGLANDTVKALQKLEKVTIPILIAATGESTLVRLAHLAAQLKTALLHPTTIVNKTVQVITPGVKALEGKVNALEAKVAAIGAAAPSVIFPPITITPGGVAVPGLGRIYRGIDSLWRETKRIGKIVTPVGIVGLVAGAVLATLKLPWLKCRNVDKVGRKLCGMNTKLLDDLLGGLLVIFGTFSLVEFAKYMVPVAKELTGEVTHFWRADVAHAAADRQIGSPGLTDA